MKFEAVVFGVMWGVMQAVTINSKSTLPGLSISTYIVKQESICSYMPSTLYLAILCSKLFLLKDDMTF